MLQASVRVGREEVAIHAGMVGALLDEFDLHVAGIGQTDRDMDVVVAPA